MIETEDGILHTEGNPLVTIIKDVHKEGKTIIEIVMTVDSKGLEVNPYHQVEYLELHQGLPVEIRTDVSVADTLIILPGNVSRKILLQVKYNMLGIDLC